MPVQLAAATDDSPSDDKCQGCGATVTSRFQRVFGDSDGVVHRCFECDTKRRVGEGSAAGLDVPSPDPKDDPGRAQTGHANRGRGFK